MFTVGVFFALHSFLTLQKSIHHQANVVELFVCNKFKQNMLCGKACFCRKALNKCKLSIFFCMKRTSNDGAKW